MKDFFLSWLLLSFVSWIVNGTQTSSGDFIGAIISGLIITIAIFILNRITSHTKVIHFYYWILRTLHLRKKATGKFVKKGDMFILEFDKLDPGESLKIEGEFLLSNGKMERVDNTKKSKRKEKHAEKKTH